MESKSKIYIFAALIFIILGFYSYFALVNIERQDRILRICCTPKISFLKEENFILVNGSIDDCNLSKDELIWENISIEGEAIKPYGIIEKGDIISNCSGNIKIIWIPENHILFEDYF